MGGCGIILVVRKAWRAGEALASVAPGRWLIIVGIGNWRVGIGQLHASS